MPRVLGDWLRMAILLARVSLIPLHSVKAQTIDQPVEYFVNPDGDDFANDGLSPSSPFRTIQIALNLAGPGATIHLAPGEYFQDVFTVRHGTADQPITIVGTHNAEIRGRNNNRVFQVHHDYIHLIGFTIDGLRRRGDPNRASGYQEKLLYVIGHEQGDGVNGMKILHMTLRNASEECLRIRHYAYNNEIAYNTIHDCGTEDFRFGGSGKVGEAIYLGTSSNQWNDGKNATPGPDRSHGNWIHHNVMNTQGNECVEAKEGTYSNIIEYNVCTGQKDAESGGIVSRGDGNIIRYNEIFGNAGAGVRLGGHFVDGVQYGLYNHVYGNILYENAAGGVKVMAGPQGSICDNQLWNNPAGEAVGELSAPFAPSAVCQKGQR